MTPLSMTNQANYPLRLVRAVLADMDSGFVPRKAIAVNLHARKKSTLFPTAGTSGCTAAPRSRRSSSWLGLIEVASAAAVPDSSSIQKYWSSSLIRPRWKRNRKGWSSSAIVRPCQGERGVEGDEVRNTEAAVIRPRLLLRAAPPFGPFVCLVCALSSVCSSVWMTVIISLYPRFWLINWACQEVHQLPQDSWSARPVASGQSVLKQSRMYYWCYIQNWWFDYSYFWCQQERKW
jgi:hypothetical protein